jgi:hypothetical protein
MSSFFFENKLTTDSCATSARERENQSIRDYQLFNFYGACDNSNVASFAAANPNLTYRNGYGVSSACTIDQDSTVRLTCLGHGPERRQLPVRNFVAVPDMSRGCSLPDTESYLINGQDTTLYRECDRLTEKDFNRFVPLMGCTEDYIKGFGARDYFPIGIDSREETRKKLGACSR